MMALICMSPIRGQYDRSHAAGRHGPRDPPSYDRRRGAGWEYLHVCIDDASRLARCLRDERKESTVPFLERALAWSANHGVTVERVMTDNGSAYRSTPLAAGLREPKASASAEGQLFQGGRPLRFEAIAPRDLVLAETHPLRYRWFADSPVEGDGFELSVPDRKRVRPFR